VKSEKKTSEKSTVPGAATQKMVAELAGVSQGTVAHILGTRGARYKESTRARVQEAALRLNYSPHIAAQMMQRGRSNLVGIIHFGNAYRTAIKIAHHLPQLITSQGFEPFVIDMSWHGGCRQQAIRQLLRLRVEGVIICQQVETFGIEEARILTEVGIPAVSLAGSERIGLPAVYPDLHDATSQLVRHLVARGHRRLMLMVSGHLGRPPEHRVNGFCEGIRLLGGRLAEWRHGTPLPETTKDGIVEGMIIRLRADRGTLDSGLEIYECVQRLIACDQLPDAMVCASDFWAREVFAAMMEAGLHIPGDMAVTGFDNETFGARAPYHLTTVAPDTEEQCEKAVEILMDMIQGRPAPNAHFVYPCKLIVRESCGAKLQTVTPDPANA
jgi:DNA-binding LacI/PurR family transcriptional regulator